MIIEQKNLLMFLLIELKISPKQILKTFSFRDNQNIKLSYRSSPIDRVGVYVPGGLPIIQALCL